MATNFAVFGYIDLGGGVIASQAKSLGNTGIAKTLIPVDDRLGPNWAGISLYSSIN